MYKCLNPGNVGISLPWEACLPLASDNGFEGIDLPIDPQLPASKYLEALDRYHLRAGGTVLPFHLAQPESEMSEALGRLPAISQRAQEVGQTRFYIWIRPFSDQFGWKDNFRFHATWLGKAARILDEHGCRLGLEFIGPRHLRIGHPYSFIRTMEGMLELCEAVGPNTGLLLDAYHWYTSLGVVDELLNLENRQVVYVHVNDGVAGVPVDQQEDLVRRLPGDTGVIDLAGFLQALRTIGYDGPVVPEPFVPELSKMPAEDAARRVGEAMQRVFQQEKA